MENDRTITTSHAPFPAVKYSIWSAVKAFPRCQFPYRNALRSTNVSNFSLSESAQSIHSWSALQEGLAYTSSQAVLCVHYYILLIIPFYKLCEEDLASITVFMEGSTKIRHISEKLHQLFVKLATACLKEEPADVERFCLEWLAKSKGMILENQVALTRGASVAGDDDISEFVKDIQTARPATTRLQKRSKKEQHLSYESSNDEEEVEEVQRVGSYQLNLDTNVITACTEEVLTQENGGALSAVNISEDRLVQIESPHQECFLFSTRGISPEELDAKTDQYSVDERMIRLFRFWDGDSSGAVDFVELVVALHKFEKVAEAGIDIQVASDALVQFVQSDTDRELNLVEFTRVIILFALNNFEKDFDEVADHMLAVATGTSESAVLKAAAGVDVSELEEADKEEEEFLRETAKCLEEDVSRNIERIRTNRVHFLKGTVHSRGESS